MTITNSFENGPNAGGLDGAPEPTTLRHSVVSAEHRRQSRQRFDLAATGRSEGARWGPQVVLSHLFARALLEEMPVNSDVESWRRDEDGGRMGLRITAAGCATIGVRVVADGSTLAEPDRLVDESAASDLAAVTSGEDLDGDVRGCGDETDAADDPFYGTITWTDESEDALARKNDRKSDRVQTWSEGCPPFINGHTITGRE